MPDESIYIKDPDTLVTAAYEGDFEVVRRLIAEGVNPNVKNEYGETGVIATAEQGFSDIIEFLLDHGTNVNEKDNDGDTALDIAKYYGNRFTVELLQSRGAKGADGPSAKERRMHDYHDAMDYLQSRYFDDRMFILEIALVKKGSDTSNSHIEQTKWAVITRRNVPGCPPVRSDEFDSHEDAVAYLKQIAPTTPRISLDRQAPNPTPSWDEFQGWLESIGIERLPY